MTAPTSQEAGPPKSPPLKEYTPDVISTDPLTDTKENEADEEFDTQTIREAPPPPDVRSMPGNMSSGSKLTCSYQSTPYRNEEIPKPSSTYTNQIHL